MKLTGIFGKKHLRALASATALLLLTASAQSENLRMLHGWVETHPVMEKLGIPFKKILEESSGGELTVTMSGPETVATYEQMEPVSSGAFQLLFTHYAYHTGITAIGLALEAIELDSKGLREAGVWDWMDKYYQKYNLKLIALPQTKGAYQLVLREPLPADGKLTGRKIRGQSNYYGVFDLLGATPVSLPPNEVYAALDKGILDGAAWGAYGLTANKWYEVAKYLMRPTFGYGNVTLSMNLDAWNGLSPEKQALVLKAGEQIENIWAAEFPKLVEADDKILPAEHGVQFTELPKELGDQINKAYAEGLWRMIDSKDPEAGKELKQFLASKGLAQ
jgi:TRAP-type C4-dicarboxylate transport system substrate-binding protein